MLATTMSVAFSVMVVNVHFKSPEHRPPQWLRRFIFGYLAKFVCFALHKNILKSSPKRRRVQRDMTGTWSEASSKDLKSQNSHATLTPDPQENYELMIQSRSKILTDDSNYDVSSAASIQTRTIAQEVHHVDLTPNGYYSPHFNEWKQIAEVLDRFFFYLFLFFLIVPTFAILGVVRLFKPDL